MPGYVGLSLETRSTGANLELDSAVRDLALKVPRASLKIGSTGEDLLVMSTVALVSLELGSIRAWEGTGTDTRTGFMEIDLAL